MAERYEANSGIPQAAGTISGGATLVLTASAEVWRALILFNGLDFGEIARLVNDPAGGILERLQAITEDQAERFLGEPPEDVFPPKDDFLKALWITGRIWQLQSDSARTTLHLAITLAPPDQSSMEIEFRGHRPGLVFHPGSLGVSFTPHRFKPLARFLLTLCQWFHATHPTEWVWYGFKTTTWMIAFFLAPDQTPDQALVDLLRDAREDGDPLDRLDQVEPEQLEGKCLILLLHGLFSTDRGTFDGFIHALPQVCDYLILGWPHNTLAGIDDNARELCCLIRKL